MATDLTAVKNALEALTDIELQALSTAASEAPPVAYGLLAWIEGACAWEMNRRCGRDYDLLPPEAAIDPSEDDVSMRAAFVGSELAPAALRFVDAIAAFLMGGGKKH